MNNESRIVFSFIPLATIAFVTALFVYQNQTNRRISQLEDQVKEAHRALAVARQGEKPSEPVAREAEPKPEVAAPEVTPPEVSNLQPQSQPQAQAPSSPPTPSAQDVKAPDRNIEAANAEIARLQARLTTLQETSNSVHDRSLTQQQQQQAGATNQAVELDQRIAVAKTAMNDLDQQLKTLMEKTNSAPPEVPLRELRAQRVDLQNRIQEMELQKQQIIAGVQNSNAQTSNQATVVRDQIRAEEEDLRRRISELQADVAKRKAEQNRTLQAQ